jgi:hypothetical protein
MSVHEKLWLGSKKSLHIDKSKSSAMCTKWITLQYIVCLTNIKLVPHTHKLVGVFGTGIWLSSGNPHPMKEVSEVGRDEEGSNT